MDFPTTLWTTIHRAGDQDPDALDRFARRYRGAVLASLRSRGLAEADAEDLCHEVFVRLLSGDVLARADADRGRFRALLLTITRRVLVDRWRKRRDVFTQDLEDRPAEIADDEFDQQWAMILAERAVARLREQGPKHHAVLAAHLAGVPGDRKKLWVAREKLFSLMRQEVALTCANADQIEDELAHLVRFLRPGR